MRLELLPGRRWEDILPVYRETPIGDLLGYHNLRRPHRQYAGAELLIGMCMDNRKVLRIPDNFAFVLRAGGANLRRMEFKVSFAVAVGGVRAVCLIGHDECGMVGLRARREAFVSGLVERGGWERRAAEEHFDRHAPELESLRGLSGTTRSRLTTLLTSLRASSLLCRLATSVPPPRFHTVRYAGVLAAASPWRPRIAPMPPTEEPAAASAEPARTGPVGGYRPWAELLARTFSHPINCISRR